jgi:FMN phosphatase YigB (HAD superfamily)
LKRIFTPSRKKVLFFDMNNTLVDQKESFNSCFLEVLGEFIGRWNPESEGWGSVQVLQTFNEVWKQASAKKAKTGKDKNKLQIDCLRHALKDFPIDRDERFIKAFLVRMKELQPQSVRLFPNVKPTLSALSEDYLIAIISNSSRKQLESHLRTTGLGEIIPSERLFTSQKGVRKPNPLIFKDALRSLDVKAQQGVMIGNSWKTDIYGATRSGLDAVWIRANHKKKYSVRKIGKEKVVLIRQINQLLDLFK